MEGAAGAGPRHVCACGALLQHGPGGALAGAAAGGRAPCAKAACDQRLGTCVESLELV